MINKDFILGYGAGKAAGGGGGGGGGGMMTLLKTQDLGHISTASTSATSLGISVLVEKALGTYDAFIYVVKAEEKKSGYHYETIGLLWQNLVPSSFPAFQGTILQNVSVDGNGNTCSRSSSTNYGIYQDGSPSKSDPDITIKLYGKYNSTYTLTIDGNYTIYVYGLQYSE